MKGVKYSINFVLPNGEIITLQNLNCTEVQDKIHELLLVNYSYVYIPNRAFIQNLHSRPNNVNRFVRSRVSLSKC